MDRFQRVLLITAFAAAGTVCVAQESSSAKASTSTKPAPAAASSPAAGGSLPSEATIDAFLKRMFGWNQELTWKVADIKPSPASGIAQATVVFSAPQGQQVQRIYITPDQQHAFTGDLVPFGPDPFVENREILKGVNGPSHGPKDAVITIVEFGDLQCPACKGAQPNITKLMEEEPKARLVFQNYPLETIHKWAMTGAKYVDCLGRQNNEAVWKFIATVYDHQAEVTEQNVDQMLKGYVKESGGDPDVVAVCVASPDTEKRIRASMALAEKLDVASTPTFFINGRRLLGFSNNGTPYDMVKTMTDYEIANAK